MISQQCDWLVSVFVLGQHNYNVVGTTGGYQIMQGQMQLANEIPLC